MTATQQTHEYVTTAENRLSIAAVRRALAYTATMEAQRQVTASVKEVQEVFEVMRHAREITITPRAGCTLTAYETMPGVGYSSDKTTLIGELVEGQHFTGHTLAPDEDGIRLEKIAHQDKRRTQWVLLGTSEGGQPDHEIVNINLEGDVSGACRAILHTATERGPAHLWPPLSLISAAWHGEANEGKFYRHESAGIALKWLIFSGQLIEHSDGHVGLPPQVECGDERLNNDEVYRAKVAIMGMVRTHPNHRWRAADLVGAARTAGKEDEAAYGLALIELIELGHLVQADDQLIILPS